VHEVIDLILELVPKILPTVLNLISKGPYSWEFRLLEIKQKSLICVAVYSPNLTPLYSDNVAVLADLVHHQKFRSDVAA
jgi:hypothetical protein